MSYIRTILANFDFKNRLQADKYGCATLMIGLPTCGKYMNAMCIRGGYQL